MTEITRQELLGKYADEEHLTPDELDELRLTPHSESGSPYYTERMREDGAAYKLSGDGPEATGYIVERVDEPMPASSVLHYLVP